MSTKKYILTTEQELTTTIMVAGKPRIVNFRDGSRVSKTRGFFVTDNTALQEAIEKDSGYGVCFKLESTIEAPASQDEQSPVDDELPLKDPDTAIHDTTVTSKAKAIAYIQGAFEDVFTSTAVDEMKREAAEKWNVVFDAWK